MISQFEKHLQKSFPFLHQKKLLVATSGGVDSMVLLSLLQQLDFDIAVAHCNFNLRGAESDADENFVVEFCQKNAIQIHVQKFDTQKIAEDFKLSIQISARKIRYEWFEELVQTFNYDYILTAHHCDDVAETFLINFTRGTGLDGLVGIPAINGNIVRPMLIFDRDDILNFAQNNHIQWREDSSNASTKYTRNKIRHQIIPILKQINPSFINSFKQTIENLDQCKTLVDDASKIVYQNVVKDENGKKIFQLNQLLRLPNYQAYLYQWLSPFQFSSWNDVYDLVHAQSGKKIESDEFVLIKNREELILSPKLILHDEVYHLSETQLQISSPINLEFSQNATYEFSDKSIIFVDASKISYPLILRKWQPGDIFYPLGMNGQKKKLSKFFKDEKLSVLEKDEIWLLCSEESIVWIIGQRQDERFKIEESTNKILKIKYSK